MKADQIIKNAKIFTANKDNLLATALVVKDGKFERPPISAASLLCLASSTPMCM